MRHPRSLLTLLPKAAIALFVVISLPLFSQSTAQATHDDFKYKFPCRPEDACYVTTLAHTGNAIDFDPQGSAGLGEIPAVSEGTFVQYFTQSEECTTSGLGMYAEIQDMHGQTLKYAHLSSFGGLQVGQRVLQGDGVGVEGNTGYTINCDPHLHLEGIAGAVIEGNSIGLGLYPSTNSIVGDYSYPGARIQQKYFALGNLFTSWAVVGWTADWTGSQAGCVQTPFCRLKVHYAPDAERGHWGSLQTFRKHPGAPVTDDGSIMAGRWGRWYQSTLQFDPYWVEQPFFAAWLGNYQRGGLAIRDRVDSSSGAMCSSRECCPVSVGCQQYQRFHTGYIWEHQTQGVQNTVFCPDIAPPYPYQDYFVDLINDILTEIGKWNQNDRDLAPFEPWADAWYDINGDGTIDLFNDILGVIGAWNTYCYPQ